MEPNWIGITRRNARSVQTTIGWIFWDPGAVARYEEIGLPGPLGYIAARCAPLAPAGPDAVAAAFGSISPLGIAMALDLAGPDGPERCWRARDEAVLEGLSTYAPEILEPLAALGPQLWPVVEQLPTVGRVLYAAHLRMERPDDPVLSGWHAVNCLREWRGDTHWAAVVAAGLTGVEASVLHNEWLRYDTDWLPTSRGSSPEEVAAAWNGLVGKGLAERTDDGAFRATDAGLVARREIEERTDALTTTPWELLGVSRSLRFADDLEGPCELLLSRVDETAGTNYQPASRVRDTDFA